MTRELVKILFFAFQKNFIVKVFKCNESTSFIVFWSQLKAMFIVNKEEAKSRDYLLLSCRLEQTTEANNNE